MRQKQGVFSLFLLSPSSRRAWIEMLAIPSPLPALKVALLAEGVDRNNVSAIINTLLSSRPPRGGRG